MYDGKRLYLADEKTNPFSATSDKAGLPRLHGAQFEDNANEIISMELVLSPNLWIGAALPCNVAGIIAAGARRPVWLRQLIVASQE